MCYWVGTKNVRQEMLQRKNSDPQNEITQLFYENFEGSPSNVFHEHYVAIGKSQPGLSVLYQNTLPGFTTMLWGIHKVFKNRKTSEPENRIMINSTSEKAFNIHKDIIYNQRCIAPIDGYYEFFHFAGDVFPHFIHPKEGVFFAAGVYAVSGETPNNANNAFFSLLTCPPNALAKKLHNNPKAHGGSRMLALLHEKDIPTYLNPQTTKKELEALLTPYPTNQMEAYPVHRFLRKEFAGDIHSPKVRERVDYPQLILAE